MPNLDHQILVNRAPILTLWAAIAAILVAASSPTNSAFATSPMRETAWFVGKCADPRWTSDKGVCDGYFYAAAQAWAIEPAQLCHLKSIREVSDGMLGYLSAHPEHGELPLVDSLHLAIVHSPVLCSPNEPPVALSEIDLAAICGWRVDLYRAGLCEGFVTYVRDTRRPELRDLTCRGPETTTILIAVKSWADTATKSSERPAIGAVGEVLEEKFPCAPAP
jgi:hypothetical protein